MRLLFIFAALMVTLSLTACMAEKPAQYPPSATMERDSMPDKVDDAKK